MNEKKKTGACDGRRRVTENSLSSYLRDIGRIPLLSKEEEMETAKLAAGGDKAAREKLVTSNLRFVIMIAKKYQGNGLPLLDLISEGNMGLLSAVKHFDVEKGYRFITYAVWWVRQAITKAIQEKGKLIRLPCKAKPGKALSGGKDPRRKPKEIVYINNDVLSLDEPVSKRGDSNSTRKDFLYDEFTDSPVEKAANSILKSELETLLGDLEERAAGVIRCRFGLDGTGPMTLKEVGDRYHLSRERVRQIETRAMSQLEASSREHKLDSYIA